MVLQSAVRALCPHLADKEHTCSLKSIFRGVHAAAENVILLYFAMTSETLRGFVGSLGGAAFRCPAMVYAEKELPGGAAPKKSGN
jgi:hypothetical protein